MKPIVVTVDENGETKLTPEQLQVLLNDAYNEGYADGSRSVVITTPTYPQNTPPFYTPPPIITCTTGD